VSVLFLSFDSAAHCHPSLSIGNTTLIDEVAKHYMPSAGRPGSSQLSFVPAPLKGQASKLFFKNILQHLFVQAQVRYKLL
jgi:hypothetical protein